MNWFFFFSLKRQANVTIKQNWEGKCYRSDFKRNSVLGLYAMIQNMLNRNLTNIIFLLRNSVDDKYNVMNRNSISQSMFMDFKNTFFYYAPSSLINKSYRINAGHKWLNRPEWSVHCATALTLTFAHISSFDKWLAEWFVNE